MDEPQDFEPTAYNETTPSYPLQPQTAPPTAKTPRRWRRGTLRAVGLGAVVVLAAGTSGVVVHQLDASNSGTSATASTTLVPPAAGVASVQSALAKAEKSVVIINDTMTSSSSSGRGGFGSFGNQAYTSSAAGTGIIISADGEVVTNAHVVNGASNIQITLPDGTKKAATVLGANTSKDLAVLKIAGVSGLTPATWANSDSAQAGDQVIAIGNAEGYGGSPSVTQGILSAKDRSLSSSDGGNASSENLTGLLQTDAAINPGNSGGPLVDGAGDVLGIDTAVATGTTSEPAQNIGFAIPSNTVVAAIPALKAGGPSSGSSGGSTTGSGAVLGVSVADQSGTTGAVVAQVSQGSGAAKAGLQSGDVITKVGSTSVSDAQDLATAIQSHQVGDTVKITFTRNGTTKTATATLGAASTTSG